MKRIFYSRSAAARASFVLRYQAENTGKKMVYLLPKKFRDEVSRYFPDVELYCYEDISTSNAVFDLASDDRILALDRPARYKNITSQVWMRLSRAAARYQHKCMVDIVPFTVDVQYIYCPLALVDRGILGYQHWYSFRENNLEQTAGGEQVRAFDYEMLAGKLAAHADIDYSRFSHAEIEIASCPLTSEERSEYQVLRDRLFTENKTASPIITTLSDWTNIRESRYQRLRQLLETATGKVCIYTNLGGHNRRLKQLFPGVSVRSFYDANGEESFFATIILFEIPIVKNYLFLDVLAASSPDCRVYVFRSDTTVDSYLWGKMNTEYTSINEFTKCLCKEVR